MPNVPQKRGGSRAGPERRSACINVPPLPKALPAQERERKTPDQAAKYTTKYRSDGGHPSIVFKETELTINYK